MLSKLVMVGTWALISGANLFFESGRWTVIRRSMILLGGAASLPTKLELIAKPIAAL